MFEEVMDLTSLTEDINVSTLLVMLLVVLPLVYLIKSATFKGQNLPPGPRPWPIIGNIPHVVGRKPNEIVTNMAKVYGPLLSLRVGSRVMILGSSPAAAHDILKIHDRELSARYIAKATPIKESELKQFSLLWSTERSHQWKSIRDLWTDLFSSKAMESQASMREKKVAEMVEFLGTKKGQVVNIRDVVFTTVYNLIGNICFSKDMIDLGNEKGASESKNTIWGLMESGTTPILADFWPIFDAFDIEGQRKKTKACIDKLFKLWEDIIKVRREHDGPDASKQRDFLHFMLANGCPDIQIKHMLLEVFPAATGNIPTTVEWALTELIKNEEAMKKVEEELRGAADSNSMKESVVLQLPYLNACIKETLRLHPPIAFLPHCAHETCQVLKYTIPKNALVLVNVWGMGRDPMIWEDPLAFKPERFLNSNLDFKGHDFEYLPFGSGRRMCPGLPFAAKQVHLILASLIGCFDWSLANGADPSQLDMNEKYSVPIRKEQALLLVPARK